jgi:hypothetical protein
MIFERDALLRDLRSHVIEVTFNKVDGSTRVMRCTLDPIHLPTSYKEDMNEETKFHQKNTDIIACWDIQKGGWRSFRIDSVLYVQIIDNY